MHRHYYPEGQRILEPGDFNARALGAGALLWHYTGFQGLKGILDGSMWASSLPYLNDTEEFRHGIPIALELLHNELAIALRGDYVAHSGAIFSEVSKLFTEGYQPRDVFVASFSTKKDDLSQWRAYGGPGPVFSVGFDPIRLERTAHQSLFELEEVKYNKANIVAELRLVLREPINHIRDALQKKGTTAETVKLSATWAADIAGELLLQIPRYKHPTFSAEEEWRLIRRQPVLTREPRLPLRFRQSGSLVVPYIAMPLHAPRTEAEVYADGETVESPVCAIVIGPSPHLTELEYAVGEMAARTGLSVNVESSQVPFRNW